MSVVPRDFEGKVAIVTGAGNAGAVGVTTARRLAEGGARVVLADVAGGPLEATTRALAADGLAVRHCAVDISSEQSVAALMRFTVDAYGRLDILDNNAASQGQPEDRDVGSLSVELWDQIMGVNARGAMLMCKHALPVMIAGGGGSIINISSGTSMAGDHFATAYACSKGAVNTLTKYVATQYGTKGIRCNALILGLIETPTLLRALPQPMIDLFLQQKLLRRLGQPADVAEMVAFLASDRSSFITGQLLPVDGGFYAHTPSSEGLLKMIQAMHGSAASGGQ